jgi:hypothetical protein
VVAIDKLERFFRQAGGIDVDKSDLRISGFFAALDRNHDGAIDRAELALARKMMSQAPERGAAASPPPARYAGGLGRAGRRRAVGRVSPDGIAQHGFHGADHPLATSRAGAWSGSLAAMQSAAVPRSSAQSA